jgi:hypothetical protein
MNIETATGSESAQDIVNRIEGALYPSDEPEASKEDEALEGAEELPEGDDSDSEKDDGSDESETDELNEEELSLAAYLGIPEDRIVVDEKGNVLFNAIIDGETKAVPLKELAVSFQLQGHVNNKSIALENERKEFNELKSKAAQHLQEQLQGAETLVTVLEQQLVGEFNNIDWNSLRQSDPSEWAVLRQEYAEKAQRIQQAQAFIKQEQTNAQVQQQEQFAANYKAHLAEERRKAIAKNPDWQDETKYNSAMTEMKSFLTSTYGYTEDDFNSVSDHRLFEIIKDAQSFRQGKKAAEDKKLKPVPKFQKPGAARGNAASLAKARQVKAVKAQAKKTGSVKDVAAAIQDRM